MAYGDLKVRNLIWNTGSGDNTVVLSTLATQSYVTTNFAPKANPTFTGTVTVPTASANDNTTKAASTAYVQAELTSYITVSAANSSYATKASPAFTGTATGVNLTLSGNLTVNGTQTIINTQTLDVEDKQIEIGKVSNPSDTTADQGGWKLKGATDKTFLWVNASDAWTSSEHIALGDDKKLILGGTSELQILHDGTTNKSVIQTTTTDPLLIKCAGDLNFVYSSGGSEATGGSWDPGGAWSFSHGSSTKLTTTSTGINVVGAITVNGSALSSAPTVTATASGAIGNQVSVVVNSDGTVSAVGIADPSFVDEQTFESGNVKEVSVALDPHANKVLVCYCDQNDGNAGKAVAGSISGSEITFGSPVEFIGETAMISCAFRDASDSQYHMFGIVYQDLTGSNNRVRGKVAIISGTNTLSIGSQYNGEADDLAGTENNMLLFYDRNTDYFGYVARWDGGHIRRGVVNLSGNNSGSPSFSWANNGIFANSSQNNGSLRSCWDPDQNKTIVSSMAGSMEAHIRYVTLNSGNWQEGGSESVTGGANVSHGHRLSMAYCEAHNVVVITWHESSAGQKVGLYKWNGSKYDDSGSKVVLNASGSYERVRLTAQRKSAENDEVIAVYALNSTDDLTTQVLTVSNDTTVAGATPVVVNTTGTFNKIGAPTVSHPTTGEMIFAYMNSGGKSVVRKPAATNANLENFIGFSSAAYSNGNTATINVVGNTTTQSSLTPGQKYFVQDNGSLGTTASANVTVAAGTALTSTKLLIHPYI
tara:strand:- start:92 stop:2380 length:2289 start_codon:yes stop_codon:yes gene_type:complete